MSILSTRAFAWRQCFEVAMTGLLVALGAAFVAEIRLPTAPSGLATTRVPDLDRTSPVLEDENRRVELEVVQDGVWLSPVQGNAFVLEPGPFELHLRGDCKGVSYVATFVPEIVDTLLSAEELVAAVGSASAPEDGSLVGLHEVHRLAPIGGGIGLGSAEERLPVTMPWRHTSLAPSGNAPNSSGQIWRFDRLEQEKLEDLEGSTVHLVLFAEQPLTEVGSEHFVALNSSAVIRLMFRSKVGREETARTTQFGA